MAKKKTPPPVAETQAAPKLPRATTGRLLMLRKAIKKGLQK